MIKAKKGAAAHVEIIISFVIFLLVVIFLLFFFNPLKKYSTSTTSLDSTEAAILKLVSTDLTTVSISLDTANPETPPIGACISVPLSFTEPIIVKDENLNNVNAERAMGMTNFIRSTGKFFRIYSSEELVESSVAVPCVLPSSEFYTLGVHKTEKKVSYNKLMALNDAYVADYEQLKEYLNLTNELNIAVRVGSEYLFNAEKYEPKNIEIMAKDVPIEILNKDGDIIYGVMNIQVWE